MMKISNACFLVLLLLLIGCGNDNGVNGSGDGEATITINGELYAVEKVTCGTGPEDYRITADGPEYSFVQVQFPDWRDPQYDNGSVLYDLGGKEHSFSTGRMISLRTNQSDEVNVTGSENHATGRAVVYERPFTPSDRGASIEIQLEIRCPG
jgi:hypothetical protein